MKYNVVNFFHSTLALNIKSENSNFYLVKPLRYQQKKSERTDSCHYGCHLPYMGIDTTEHAPHLYYTCPFLKFLIPDMPTFTKNASFQPGLGNRKWPTCLGQVEEQLKKWVGSIPITPILIYEAKIQP